MISPFECKLSRTFACPYNSRSWASDFNTPFYFVARDYSLMSKNWNIEKSIHLAAAVIESTARNFLDVSSIGVWFVFQPKASTWKQIVEMLQTKWKRWRWTSRQESMNEKYIELLYSFSVVNSMSRRSTKARAYSPGILLCMLSMGVSNAPRAVVTFCTFSYLQKQWKENLDVSSINCWICSIMDKHSHD